jgi:hypothetical protein
MKCPTCGQPATVHLSEVCRGQVHQLHVCEKHVPASAVEAGPRLRGHVREALSEWSSRGQGRQLRDARHSFLWWLWGYVQRSQALPSLDEVAAQGDVGRAVADRTRERWAGEPPRP